MRPLQPSIQFLSIRTTKCLIRNTHTRVPKDPINKSTHNSRDKTKATPSSHYKQSHVSNSPHFPMLHRHVHNTAISVIRLCLQNPLLLQLLLQFRSNSQVHNFPFIRPRRPGCGTLLFRQGAQDPHGTSAMHLHPRTALATFLINATMSKTQFPMLSASLAATRTNFSK